MDLGVGGVVQHGEDAAEQGAAAEAIGGTDEGDQALHYLAAGLHVEPHLLEGEPRFYLLVQLDYHHLVLF